jgi:hypothetical protein
MTDLEWFELQTIEAAGVKHHLSRFQLEALKYGEELEVVRERENDFDANAVMLRTAGGAKVGYVPATQAPMFARLIDNGHPLRAEVDYVRSDKMGLGVTLWMKKAGRR